MALAPGGPTICDERNDRRTPRLQDPGSRMPAGVKVRELIVLAVALPAVGVAAVSPAPAEAGGP